MDYEAVSIMGILWAKSLKPAVVGIVGWVGLHQSS